MKSPLMEFFVSRWCIELYFSASVGRGPVKLLQAVRKSPTSTASQPTSAS